MVETRGFVGGAEALTQIFTVHSVNFPDHASPLARRRCRSSRHTPLDRKRHLSHSYTAVSR
jgi:hypothetical protein